jgi:hypothetical protein
MRDERGCEAKPNQCGYSPQLWIFPTTCPTGINRENLTIDGVDSKMDRALEHYSHVRMAAKVERG